MKNKEIILLNQEELNGRLKAEKEMISRLRFAHTISPIENPMKIRASRRLIARLNTEIVKRSKTA